MQTDESRHQLIREGLEKVISSPGFVHSARIRRLLCHCVWKTLDRRQDELKELLIGMEVFDRGPSFDPRTDTIVRVDARRLRRKLEEYYRTWGQDDPVEFVFSPGSYVPAFRMRPAGNESQGEGSDLPIASLAVLPFWNIGSPEVEYFSDGLTEELIATLARMEGLRVVARTSAFQFKDRPHDIRRIGELLAVEAILEGSVRWSGSRIRVTAQLIDVARGRHLWSATFDRQLDDVFALQDDIARGICARLDRNLPERSGKAPPKPKAYELYLKGRYLWNQRTPDAVRQALALFRKAAEEDPKYPQPYAGISDCHSLMAIFGAPPKEVVPKAEETARKAIELDENTAEAHAALGAVKTHLWDWRGAEASFRRAVELRPGSAEMYEWYSVFLGCIGRTREAVQMIRLAQQLDPLSRYVNANVGLMLYLDRQYEESIAQFGNALASDPHFYWTHWHLGIACMAASRYDDAAAACSRGVELSGRNTPVLGCLAMAYGLSGKRQAAEEVIAELMDRRAREHVSPIVLATAYAGLGERDCAFLWIDRAAEEHSALLLWTRWPLFDCIRDDPRMERLFDRIGI